MKAHDWRYYANIPAGHLGDYDIWECYVCGAISVETDFGPRSKDPPPGEAFLPGPRLKLSDDCNIASLQIEAYQVGQQRPFGKFTNDDLVELLGKSSLSLLQEAFKKGQGYPYPNDRYPAHKVLASRYRDTASHLEIPYPDPRTPHGKE